MKQGLFEIVAATADGIQFETDGRNADLLVATCLAAAAQGDIAAYYDLGVAFSTGSHGVGCDHHRPALQVGDRGAGPVSARGGLTWPT